MMNFGVLDDVFAIIILRQVLILHKPLYANFEFYVIAIIRYSVRWTLNVKTFLFVKIRFYASRVFIIENASY